MGVSKERNNKARDLIVVFGDQLSPDAGVIANADPERDTIAMMEVGQESTHVASHIQRTVLFLSAMRHYAQELSQRGLRVEYSKITDKENAGTLTGELARIIERVRPDRIRCTLPGEWRVLAMAESWADEFGVEVEIDEDEHFLTTREQFSEWASGRKSLVMEYFYRAQRKRLGVLVDDEGEPEGGEWNFDKDNRETFGKDGPPMIASPFSFKPDDITKQVIKDVREHLPDAPGSIDSFGWAVTTTQARQALSDFIRNRLPGFGPYEDAMWQGQPTLFHSRLSPALNLKLLSPMECVEAAIEAYEKGDAPLQSVEGFVRQIIGWREFIRGVYWHEGADYRDRNALLSRGELPEVYWTGETEMNCMRQCVGEVLDHAYGHHIQRLMVTGNFALLAGVHPQQISDWYLAMYADAVDWVTLPNTLGMVMHADGGVVGTKPYAASGRYIDRMSNYCKGCRFKPGQRTGGEACPFTVLYWDFLDRNRKRLDTNHRMKMVLKNLDRIEKNELADLRARAKTIRKGLGVIS